MSMYRVAVSRILFALLFPTCLLSGRLFSAPSGVAAGNMWVTAYYTVWGTCGLPPQNIDWSAVTHIVHQSIQPTSSSAYAGKWWKYPYGAKDNDSLYFERGVGTGCASAPIQRILIDSAHAHGVKVLLGLGADEANYAAIASNNTMMLQYVTSVLNYAKSRGYDGVDVDWEFVRSNTRPAFISLINTLKNTLNTWSPAGLLSVAVPGWYNPNNDIPTMNARVDQVNLMTYDMTGYWNATTGFNAPVYSPQLANYIGDNGEGCVNAWLNNGLNPAKTGFGVPFYGLSWEGADGPVQGFSAESQVSYDWIMSKYSQTNYRWQSNGQVPYLSIPWDAATGKKYFITYEDSLSLTKKVQYAKAKGLAGVMIFELWRGLLNGKQPLMSAMKRALGNTPLPSLTPPAVPVLLSPTPGSAGRSIPATVAWNAVPGAVNYHLQVSGSSGFSSLIVNDSSLTTTSRAISGLAYSTTYYWRVAAKNSAGASAYSYSWSFTTQAPPLSLPGAFTLTAPANGAASQALSGTISWQASANAAQYDVYLGTANPPSNIISANQTGTSYNYSGLAAGMVYYCKVVAKNTSGSTTATGSPWSFATQAASATTTDLWIYQDALASPWYDWSWSSTNTYNSAAGIYAGTASIKIAQGSWGGLLLHGGLASSPVSVSPMLYGQLQFAVYNTTPGLNLNVYAGNDAGGAFPANVRYSIPVNQWTVISIPMSSLDPNNLPIQRVIIQNYTASTVAYYVDNLRFVGKTLPLTSVTTFGNAAGNEIPQSFSLDQNYPNPFNPTTSIQYGLPAQSRVSIKIYNILGELIDVVKDGIEEAGYKSAVWDGSKAASGIYFYRLDAISSSDPTASFSQIRKMMLVK